ncbi:SulP family inorganic anion transporter [Salinarimonas soli]|uniref:SulP family inorganic anion transporter n=1 Tax=Salinarimonas soli TaxID=1638099 RepID=A0A5B2VR70_9HYPH|nr:SulP family inorganic anion transporter [Salinarimonas soli]KAA2241090.1 SulP family inorganic anion transporter [Salinarimonas soli]
MLQQRRLALPEPTFAELFTPKLVTVLREGYGTRQLRADALAGLTVAIVALPLSMAIAIASGATPERGLYTAIVGGFIVSLLGGSRFQIGGPAGAFIVLVAATIDRHGIDGLALATLMAGVMLTAVGFLRLGTYIKYIPHPVIVGFTAGIAVIIFASQIRDLLGLSLATKEPAALLPKLQALAVALPTLTPAAAAVAGLTIALIVGLRRYAPALPNLLVAVVVATSAAAFLGLGVETIGSRFGGVPSSLPVPGLPPVTWAKAMDILPDAIAIALLGGVESLLSAMVADSMSGRRHRSNCELVAQGVANVASALFGGIPVTGTIARTATNVRSGAIGPVAGMLHSAFLLGFMMLAAPLASYIPLAALAGVLAVVAWNMAERHEVVAIVRRRRGETVVLLATLLLTVIRDLTDGIVAGVVLGSFLFMHRMAGLVAVELGQPMPAGDRRDIVDPARSAALSDEVRRDLVVVRLSGPLFFGAATRIAWVLERIGEYPATLILDLSAVPLVDADAAASLHAFLARARRRGAAAWVAGASPPVRAELENEGLFEPEIGFAPSVADARMAARQLARHKHT